MHDLGNVAILIQLGSGVVVALLGAFMLTVRPRRKANLAFALFAIALGVYFIARNAGQLLLDIGLTVDVPPSAGIVYTMPVLLALGGLVWVASVFPRPLARGEWRYLALPLAASGIAFALTAPLVTTALTSTPQAAVFTLSFIALVAFLGSLPAFYALRVARDQSGAAQRQFAILASAFSLYAGFIATAGAAGERSTSILAPTTTPYLVATALVPMLLAVVLWLRASARIEASRAARNTALLCAAMPLVGIVYIALDMPQGAFGLIRIAMVAFLAYGIARHQLLGIDLKLRFAISKSTIAAVFIAVFLIASEAAQEFFGAQFASAYVGIAAAGALVFAMAPLQRAAERLAERAVPVADAHASPGRPSSAASKHEEAYRRAVRLALRDRRLTHEEEIHLFHVAEALGVPAGRAMELRHEVEREARPTEAA